MENSKPQNLKSFDSMQRFKFDDYDIQGNIINCKNSFSTMVSTRNYPKCIKALLGKMQCAACLIADTLHIDGQISLQIRSSGRLKYALVKVNSNFETVGIADIEGLIGDYEVFTDFLNEDAVLLLSITPLHDKACQCILPLDMGSLEASIEEYYKNSANVKCSLKLFSSPDNNYTVGMMLSTLPTKLKKDVQLLGFENIKTLADTITEEELGSLEFDNILYRLFNEESVMLFNPVKIKYKCTCSKVHFKNALSCVSKDELAKILHEDGKITAVCQYCGKSYQFNEEEILDLMRNM